MGGSRGGIGLRTAGPASADALRLKVGAPQVCAEEDLCLTPRGALLEDENDESRGQEEEGMRRSRAFMVSRGMRAKASP